jgi:hypothetical protein
LLAEVHTGKVAREVFLLEQTRKTFVRIYPRMFLQGGLPSVISQLLEDSA